ncbi:MAG TPA: OmpA family protein, partial [Gemmatimonadaceae bacterium]|nr:OmpA family protein [Gemmatimonadaceae bacterium]
SRREKAGARTIGLGRRLGSDTTSYRPRTIAMASQRLMRELRAGGIVRASVPVILDGQAVIFDGTMSRVSAAPDFLDAMVEGAPRKLRTLHARGEFENVVRGFRMTGDWWFLDDTTDAWLVKSTDTNNRRETFSMVLASADVAGSRKGLEDALARDCRAAVYGFYFGFGSATPEPSSQPTFRMVADLLSKHPDWTLTVEGHTDSIGNAAANRQLAERRAAAVVRELAATYGIVPARLKPVGYGATRPAATNTTLEGRARNRRVELVRPCDRRP